MMKQTSRIDALRIKYCVEKERAKGIAEVLFALRPRNPPHDSFDRCGPEAAAAFLVSCALAEAFAMLCDRPCGGLAELRVVLVPGCGVPPPCQTPHPQTTDSQSVPSADALTVLDISAEFGRSIAKTRLIYQDYYYPNQPNEYAIEPEKIIAASPRPLAVRPVGDFPLGRGALGSDASPKYTGPLAVIRNKRTVLQWLDRFVEDRWFENDLLPEDRLRDKWDLLAWRNLVGEA